MADVDRPLTTEGLADCERLRDYLRLADAEPDCILCSPATRTRETLAAIEPALGQQKEPKLERHLYGGSPKQLLAQLRRLPESASSAMLIGHNPAVQALALRLAGKGDAKARARMAAGFPAGAVAMLVVDKLSWPDLGPKTCRLHSFVAPQDLV